MNTMNKIMFLVACLALVSPLTLEGRAMRRRMTSEGTGLNEISSRETTDCEMDCRFRLCELDETEENVVKRTTGAMFLLPMRREIATYPYICSQDDSENIGLVLASDEIEVQDDDGNFVKLSSLRVTSLYNSFAKKFIFPMEVNTPPSAHRSGLAIKRALTVDQKVTIDGRCMKLNIKKYEVLDSHNNVESVKKVRGSAHCLGFKATQNAPAIRIELHWTNQDDMDLEVTEPNGDEVSRGSGVSGTGGYLARDETIGNCRLTDQERDVMEYVAWPASASPLRGEYSITVKHFSTCNQGPLQWFLFVDINGTNFFFETGVHNIEVSQRNIEVDTFLVTLTS